MIKEIEIPEGYEAKIEGNKVIFVPKESKDERIRKDIIALIEFALKDGSAVSPGSSTTKEDAISWLEKKEEQKSSGWSEENERLLNIIIDILDREEHNGHLMHNDLKGCIKLLKSLRPQPKQEWTKEDNERYLSCLKRLGTGNPDQPETVNSKWFREHVCPQPHWKPSEEQMTALEASYSVLKTHDTWGEDEHLPLLLSLCNDLKNYFSNEEIR